MKLRNFALQLKASDYTIANPAGSEYPFKVLPIVSEFSFQTQYIVDFIEKKIKSEKIEVGEFNFISIRATLNPTEKLSINKGSKILEVEVLFDEEKYRKLCPSINDYTNQIPLITNESAFDDFLISMLIEGFEKITKQYDVRFQLLIDTILDFKSGGCKNEWVHKTKIIKGLGLKAILLCKLKATYFSLELLIYKSNKFVFKRELLRTKPDSLIYKYEFKDILYDDHKLTITKDFLNSPPLFQIDLDKILENVE